MNETDEKHIEARVWSSVTPIGIRFILRWLHRMLPLSVVALLFLLSRPSTTVPIVPIAGIFGALWATADIYRGVGMNNE